MRISNTVIAEYSVILTNNCSSPLEEALTMASSIGLYEVDGSFLFPSEFGVAIDESGSRIKNTWGSFVMTLTLCMRPFNKTTVHPRELF